MEISMSTKEIAEQFTRLRSVLDDILADRTWLTLSALRQHVTRLERTCALEGVDVSRLARELRVAIDRGERDKYASVGREVQRLLEKRKAA